MKKTKVKKLELNSETLRRLMERDLREAAGGATRISCPATCINC